jgi:hypothetical protein
LKPEQGGALDVAAVEIDARFSRRTRDRMAEGHLEVEFE